MATSRRLADSLDQAEDAADPYLNKLLRILATRCMAPAKYFSSSDKEEADYAHYGLAAPTCGTTCRPSKATTWPRIIGCGSTL